ncbi:FAD-dependent oxidoreductase [Salinibacterium sp. G-O1]|uniref:FAD-dependent oxidoreductase n=1 Tax=Salinibacterium sp. G-O1 TaxID=3046208 RepID=UPI0024B89284|nr:FAD-dependent oxidoreductase [Salinibacterium sp. G-O1]MDJ0333885.1 FAD-dependent oxidoreductase [Salinibacterium sp. G-O1]
MTSYRADVAVIGGGLGGVAAAIAAVRRGATVVLSCEEPWLGGQLTSQAVPPDEHPWIEDIGATATYRALRDGIRAYYRRSFPLDSRARDRGDLNPGAGWVSKLCHEPKVAVAVIEEMLAPWVSGGQLTIVRLAKPVAAEVNGARVTSVRLLSQTAGDVEVVANYVVDATELGDLLPLTGTEYVTGFESRDDTGEPHAPAVAQPDNIQALTVCFALDHVDGDHTIDKPEQYEHWRAAAPAAWGGPLLSLEAPHPRTGEKEYKVFQPNPGDDALAVDADQSVVAGHDNLWLFRRIAARDMFEPGAYASDISLVNWGMIDYLEEHVIDVDDATMASRIGDARQLSLSLLYWLQTEVPRLDGGHGWPGLRLRPDVTGTDDGLAQAPYHREGRRIRPLRRVVEQDLSLAVRGGHGAVHYPDSIGIGMYRIDLHPSTGGDGYIDVASSPFEIPLGALIPERMENLLAGAKNIGTTHVTNGCYRLHPVEWNAGEVAGLLAADCALSGRTPHQVWHDGRLLGDFQGLTERFGIPRRWPEGVSGY